MDNLKVAEFIREQRKVKGMTQKELADKLNVTDKAVSKWERGQGYPDITTLSQLAELLGTTVNELLNGEKADGQGLAETEQMLENTLEYVETEIRHHRFNRKKVSLFIVTVTLLIGIGACIICNLAINKGLTWSLYTVGGSVMVWAVAVPLICLRRYRYLVSLLSATILIYPLLVLIEYLCPVKGWVNTLALPIMGYSLIFLWLICCLHTFIKVSGWILGAVAMLSVPVLSWLINGVVDRLYGTAYGISNMVINAGAILAGLLLLCVGIYRRGKRAVK